VPLATAQRFEPESLDVLDALADQAVIGRCRGVHPQSVVAQFCESFDKTPITTAEVEDSRARRNRLRHDRVERFPPPVVSHIVNRIDAEVLLGALTDAHSAMGCQAVGTTRGGRSAREPSAIFAVLWSTRLSKGTL
jgi:hypothetical protein